VPHTNYGESMVPAIQYP